MSIENGPVAGRMRLRLLPTTIQLRDFDTENPGWNLATATALNGDCATLPNGEVHVDRNGNDPTSPAPGEIEASYDLSLRVEEPPSLSFERRPANGCELIALSLLKSFDVSFGQLWSQDDQFGGRQAVETIDLEKVWLESWTLRDFDPATGSETNSGVFGF